MNEVLAETLAEALVRQAPEINKVVPKFKPGVLEAVIRAAEQDVFTWRDAVKIVELGLKMHPLLALDPAETNHDHTNAPGPTAARANALAAIPTAAQSPRAGVAATEKETQMALGCRWISSFAGRRLPR